MITLILLYVNRICRYFIIFSGFFYIFLYYIHYLFFAYPFYNTFYANFLDKKINLKNFDFIIDNYTVLCYNIYRWVKTQQNKTKQNKMYVFSLNL